MQSANKKNLICGPIPPEFLHPQVALVLVWGAGVHLLAQTEEEGAQVWRAVLKSLSCSKGLTI